MAIPPQIQAANLGMADSLILMVMALVVFGPRRLPQIGRQIGKLMYEFRKASNDFKFQMEEELRLSEEAERRQKEEAERQRVAALAAANPVPAPVPVQTVEAAADIGAIEPSSASPYPGESQYPAQYPPETSATSPTPASEPSTDPLAEAVTEPVSNPRIQPPWTGEPVAAARPFFVASGEPPADSNAAAPAEAESPVSEGLPNSEIQPPTPPTEPVSQHG